MLNKTLVIFVRFSVILLILSFIIGCASSPQSNVPSKGGTPAWVTDKDSLYPSDKYLAEIGEADTLRAAKSNAAGAIAQIFRTKVTVNNTLRTRYSEITDANDESLGLVTQTDFDQTIGQSANESLFNLKYGETWQDNMGRVYTIAYLDRNETGNLYRQRILENDKRVSELINRSDAQEDPLKRYAFLDAALVIAEANAVLQEQLEIINLVLSRTIIHSYDMNTIQATRADQATATRIRIEVSGDESGQIEAFLSDWVTSKGFSVSPDGEMFLTAVFFVSPLDLDNKYENYTWELNLNLIDSTGISALSLPKQNRTAGISESAAIARMYQDIAELIQKDFEKIFRSYLNSFLEK